MPPPLHRPSLPSFSLCIRQPLHLAGHISPALGSNFPLIRFFTGKPRKEREGGRREEKKKKLPSQIFLPSPVFISDCSPLSLSAHFCSPPSAHSRSSTLLPPGPLLPSPYSLRSLILITNSNLITSILNNSSEALDSWCSIASHTSLGHMPGTAQDHFASIYTN